MKKFKNLLVITIVGLFMSCGGNSDKSKSSEKLSGDSIKKIAEEIIFHIDAKIVKHKNKS